MKIKDFLRGLIRKDARLGIGIGSKKPFDPAGQVRKDPIKEMIKKDNRRKYDKCK